MGRAIRFETGDEDYLGWISAEKLEPNQRILELFADEPEHPEFVRAAEARAKPYRIRAIELSRAVHERGEYESNEDYRRRQLHSFETKEQAEAWLLDEHGVAVEDLRDLREVEHP